jgi:uncharacterized membrane protein HdeD (DUF308 family)
MATTSHVSRWSLFLGVIYILVGMMAIAVPMVVTLSFIFFSGILLTAAGVAGLIHAFWVRGWAGFAVQLLAGVLATCMGILLIYDSAAGAMVVTLIVATYLLVGGFFKAGFAISHPTLGHRSALIFSGAISILLGVLILAHWPISGLWVIGTFIGVDLIFYGFSMISAAKTH